MFDKNELYKELLSGVLIRSKQGRDTNEKRDCEWEKGKSQHCCVISFHYGWRKKPILDSMCSQHEKLAWILFSINRQANVVTINLMETGRQAWRKMRNGNKMGKIKWEMIERDRRKERTAIYLYTFKNQNQVCCQVRFHVQGLLVFGPRYNTDEKLCYLQRYVQ